MRFNRKYYSFWSNLLIALLMTFLMTLVTTLCNLGFIANFWQIFIRSYGVSLLVAIPVTFFVIPLVNKILERFF